MRVPLRAARAAVGVDLVPWRLNHPGSAFGLADSFSTFGTRFGNGFSDFYGTHLQFDPRVHVAMHELVLSALFLFALGVTLFAAARKPVASALVLLVGAGGWVLTGAALRPVGRMTAEAQTITLVERGRRLRVPAGNDEIARLGRTLNAMLDRIESSVERERAFVADASHELRTPLAMLKAELELALRRSRSREELERSIRSAAEETDRLARIADDLLLLARAGQGILPLQTEPTDLVDVLQTVIQRFSARAEAEGRPISVALEEAGGAKALLEPGDSGAFSTEDGLAAED